MPTCVENYIKTVIIGDGTTIFYAIEGAVSNNAANYRVDIDGILLEPDVDYTFDSSGNITFTTAPAVNSRVVVIADSTDTSIYYDGEPLQNISPNAPEITSILKTECIGNSLATINNNFSSLKRSICTVDNFVAADNKRISKLDTVIGGISTPQLAKAFVMFDGTSTQDINGNKVVEVVPTLTERFSINSFNVDNVVRNGAGDYTISFATSAFTDNTYLMVGTTRRPLFVTYHETLVPTAASIRVNVITPGNIATDTDLVSLIFYK